MNAPTPQADGVQARIADLIQNDNVVLFMKGVPSAPRCGFSARVVGILEDLGAEFASVDVLADGDVRQGIKTFSDWPTIPQLYVGGEFIGGCDIITEMHGAGELASALGVELSALEPPSLTITQTAAKAIADAMQADAEHASGEETLRLHITSDFRYDLHFGPKQASDVVAESQGVMLALNRASVPRAEGMVLDFVSSGDGGGFKIQNPNEPPKVRDLRPADLQERMQAGTVHVFDVRTQDEWDRAHVEGVHLLAAKGQQALDALAKDAPVAFLCHHGGRSLKAAQGAIAAGYREVYNVLGGIDAWSLDIDPQVPRY